MIYPILIAEDDPKETGGASEAAPCTAPFCPHVLRICADVAEPVSPCLIVTHNPEIAKRAERVIKIKDGKLVEERMGELNTYSEEIAS